MTPGQKRALWVGGLAGVGTLLFVGVAFAAKKQEPSAPTKWRNASNADVARDGVQPVYVKLLNTQPVGYSETGTYNGNFWKFVVCSAGNCDPPSAYQKDVRGYIGTA